MTHVYVILTARDSHTHKTQTASDRSISLIILRAARCKYTFKKEEQMLRQLTFKCRTGENVLSPFNAHQSHKAYCAWPFSMYVPTKQCLDHAEQESKKHNLQFMFLIHLWPWNGSRSPNLVRIRKEGRKHRALHPQKPWRPIRDREVGEVENFYI